MAILRANEVKCDKADCCNWQKGVCMALSKKFKYKCPFYKTREENEKQLKRIEEKRYE